MGEGIESGTNMEVLGGVRVLSGGEGWQEGGGGGSSRYPLGAISEKKRELCWYRLGNRVGEGREEDIVFACVSEAERKRRLVQEAGVGLVVLLSSQKRRLSFFTLCVLKNVEDQRKSLFVEDPLQGERKGIFLIQLLYKSRLYSSTYLHNAFIAHEKHLHPHLHLVQTCPQKTD